MININNKNYELIKNEKDAWNKEEFENLFTDYFYEFDYIVGDIAYSKLRLKGFYDSKNPKVKDINNIDNLEQYLRDYCAVGCKYFVIKRVKWQLLRKNIIFLIFFLILVLELLFRCVKI